MALDGDSDNPESYFVKGNSHFGVLVPLDQGLIQFEYFQYIFVQVKEDALSTFCVAPMVL